MFPLAALLEVGNTNLDRVELIWSPITTHLGEVSHGNEENKDGGGVLGVEGLRGRERTRMRGPGRRKREGRRKGGLGRRGVE